MLLLAVCIVLWWRNFQLDLEKFHSISFGFLKIFKFSSQNWGWKKFRFGKFWRQNSYGSKRWFPKPIVIQMGSQTLSSMLIGIEYVRFRLLDHQIDCLIWSLSTERFSSFSLDKFHQSYDSHQQLNASVVLASKIDPKMIEQCREWIGLIFWERKKKQIDFLFKFDGQEKLATSIFWCNFLFGPHFFSFSYQSIRMISDQYEITNTE